MRVSDTLEVDVFEGLQKGPEKIKVRCFLQMRADDNQDKSYFSNETDKINVRVEIQLA